MFKRPLLLATARQLHQAVARNQAYRGTVSIPYKSTSTAVLVQRLQVALDARYRLWSSCWVIPDQVADGD